MVPIYLVELGFSPLAVGAIVTSTLIGTALLTLWDRRAHRLVSIMVFTHLPSNVLLALVPFAPTSYCS